MSRTYGKNTAGRTRDSDSDSDSTVDSRTRTRDSISRRPIESTALVRRSRATPPIHYESPSIPTTEAASVRQNFEVGRLGDGDGVAYPGEMIETHNSTSRPESKSEGHEAVWEIVAMIFYRRHY